jgi:hypothetical protein
MQHESLAIAAMAATLPLVAVGTASAQTGMMHGVVHAGMKARCSPGDPNVMVNRKIKHSCSTRTPRCR